ncbi:hypothetical protein CGMCC3_g5991 [Colletotrichum fructicola]|nr:uncharacterized protein CGMCC3_g5991 [Colletotrichum fructicola]KAE9578062.1 hypothetical protein CGMCC3_g5991 [Colletotrichum fructicola]
MERVPLLEVSPQADRSARGLRDSSHPAKLFWGRNFPASHAVDPALCNVNTKHGYRSRLPGDVEDFGSQHLPDLTSTRRTPWSQTRRKTRNDGETLSLRAVTFNVATDAWLDGCEPKVAAPKRRRSRSHRDD